MIEKTTTTVIKEYDADGKLVKETTETVTERDVLAYPQSPQLPSWWTPLPSPIVQPYITYGPWTQAKGISDASGMTINQNEE